jgi:hypothetical protein
LSGVAAWRRGGVVAWWRGGVVAWWRGGVVAWWRGGVVAYRRIGVSAYRRGGVVAWWRGGVAAWWRIGVVAYRRVGVSACRSPWDIPPRFNDPSVGMVDHFDDLPDDLVTSVIESRECLRRDISVTKCNLQVYLCFGGFCLRVIEL